MFRFEWGEAVTDRDEELARTVLADIDSLCELDAADHSLDDLDRYKRIILVKALSQARREGELAMRERAAQKACPICDCGIKPTESNKRPGHWGHYDAGNGTEEECGYSADAIRALRPETPSGFCGDDGQGNCPMCGVSQKAAGVGS